MSIRNSIATRYHAIQLARKYPASQRLKVMRDYISLYRAKGLTPEEYYEFEFEKQSEEFRRDFLGLNEQRYYLDLLNPLKYFSLARNKYMAHKMLENTGVRTSELYCYYQPEATYAENTECAGDIDGVLRILKTKGVQSCVIKTTESSHGDNVLVIQNIDYQDGNAILTRFDGQQLLLSFVLSNDPLIFESLVRQTEQFAAFNASSVNTVRFMTALYPDGSAKVIATFIKIGRAGRCVDNAGGGGNVDVCVDVATGKICHAIRFDGWHRVQEIDSHPDSGNPLNGVVIENWDSIKAEVICFQQAFPYCKVAGWDIAITDEGPVVIEVNDFWDRTGQFFIRKGWRNEIRDCYLTWKATEKDYSVGPQRLPLTDKTMAAKFK
ncbi:MAG: hypothetical protein J6P54_08155 [Bacteroidales bacterium]|nr:hypothetical protein [Bacteroidales bacterium]